VTSELALSLAALSLPEPGPLELIWGLLATHPFGWVVVLAFLGGLLVHLGIGVGVYLDARRRRTELLPPSAWALLAMFVGVFGLLIYWLVNKDAPRLDRGGRAPLRRS